MHELNNLLFRSIKNNLNHGGLDFKTMGHILIKNIEDSDTYIERIKDYLENNNIRMMLISPDGHEFNMKFKPYTSSDEPDSNFIADETMSEKLQKPFFVVFKDIDEMKDTVLMRRLMNFVSSPYYLVDNGSGEMQLKNAAFLGSASLMHPVDNDFFYNLTNCNGIAFKIIDASEIM